MLSLRGCISVSEFILPFACPSSGGNTNKGRKGRQRGRSQTARTRHLFLLQDNPLLLGAVYLFFRECPIQKFDFSGLNLKSLVSIEVSNSTQNYGQLQDWPTQDSYLNSIPQSSGASFGEADGEELGHRSLMSVLEVLRDWESRLPC